MLQPILTVTILPPLILSFVLLLRFSTYYYNRLYMQTNIPSHYATVLFLDAWLDTHEVVGIIHYIRYINVIISLKL